MTLMSGNTFGARVWTDGRQEAPMMPRPPAVVKCRHCANCYWLADAAEIGRVWRWGKPAPQVDPAWIAAQEVEEPAEAEYYLAVESNLARDRKQEKFLRILAWRRHNDAYRHLPPTQERDPIPASGACKENLEALVNLLEDANTDDLLLKAEALREMGAFKAARETLDRITSSKYSKIVRQTRSLCENSDAGVRELQFDS
jgi:hypothetical protein